MSRILASRVSSGAYHAVSHQDSVCLDVHTFSDVVPECGDVDKHRTRQGLDSSSVKRVCSKGTKAQKHQPRLTVAQRMAHGGLGTEKGLLAWPIST